MKNSMNRGFIKNFLRNTPLWVAIILLLFILAGAGIAEAGVSRIGGGDRYATSALLAREVYEHTDTVIIARGDPAGQFADGLASSVLARAFNAPVLLTRPDRLPGSIAEAIMKLGAREAILLGGTGAISEPVEERLKELGLAVSRIGGRDRYDTAAKIAAKAGERGVLADFAFIVNGIRPADSLLSAPAAFKNRAIILQVSKNSIPAVTKNALKSLGVKQVYIVGGTGVVGSPVEHELSDLVEVKRRFAGINRYATGVDLAKEFFPGEKNPVLAGGPEAGLADSIGTCIFNRPVLYVKPDEIPRSVQEHLKNTVTAASDITIIGGPAVISPWLMTEVESLVVESNIEQAEIENGRATIVFKEKPLRIPAAGDYAVTASIVGGGVKEPAQSNFCYDGKVTVTFDFEKIDQIDRKQIVLFDLLIDGLSIARRYVEIGVAPSPADFLYLSSNFKDNYLKVEIINNTLFVEGSTLTDHQWALFRVEDNSRGAWERVWEQVVSIDNKELAGSYDFFLPEGDYTLSVYYGRHRLGNYEGVYRNIPLASRAGVITFPKAAVYKNNKTIADRRAGAAAADRDFSAFSREERAELLSLAQKITRGISDDYEKVLKIAEWVSENIYYDYDAYYSGDYGACDAISVLNEKKGVCQGYAELTRALMRAAGIPARIVCGHALGLSAGGRGWGGVDHSRSNHAWNEVYVGKRWITIDTTWNSTNRYEDGAYHQGETKYVYFDPTIETFSYTHKIIEY